jgi:hypothetical protein
MKFISFIFMFFISFESVSMGPLEIDDVLLRNSIARDKLNPSAKDFQHSNQIEINETDSVRNDLSQFLYDSGDILDVKLDFLKSRRLFKKQKISKRTPFGRKHNQSDLSYDISDGTIKALVSEDPNFINQNKIEKELKFKFFRSPFRGRRPLMIVFPPIMGNTVVDSGVATKLVKKGANVVLANLPSLFVEGTSLKEMQKNMYQRIVLVKMLVDHLIEKEEFNIDEKHIGTFGVSSGAIMAASVTGIVDSIKYAYLLVGGGNLADIANHSERTSVTAFRKAEYKNNLNLHGLSEEQKYIVWQNIAEQTYQNVDPLYYAKNIDPKKVFMVMSTNDATIPFRNQLELWNALGRPAYELSAYNHIGTIVRWRIQSADHAINFLMDPQQ